MFGDKIQKKENLPYAWLTHWKWATMVAKIRLVRDTRLARDLRVDFSKLAPLRDFETSWHAVNKL